MSSPEIEILDGNIKNTCVFKDNHLVSDLQPNVLCISHDKGAADLPSAINIFVSSFFMF